MAATYAPASTCPDTCPLKDGGCYNRFGNCARHLARLSGTAMQVAHAEAKAIRLLSGARPMRLHVAGDCRTDYLARIVSSACAEYSSRHDMPVFGYTHAHNVSRESWGKVSILRSCNTIQEVLNARDSGFASTIMVKSGSQVGVELKKHGLTLKACPAESGKVTCETCKLCLKDSRLRAKGIVIAFTPHGPGRKQAESVAL